MFSAYTLRPLAFALLIAVAGCGDSGPQEFVISPVGDQMKYQQVMITAQAGTQVKVVMNNTATSEAMVHNVSVLNVHNDADVINEVGTAAMQAGEANGYLPDHPAILASTPMAKPGERTEVTFTMPPPGDYTYLCLFPGHYLLMQGTLRSTP